MHFIELQTGADARSFHIRGLPVVWNPDGHSLVYLRETNVFLLDGQTGKVRRRFDFPNWLFGAAWAPDGAHLAVASDDRLLYILDTQTGQTNAFAGHQGAVTAVSFSPDGSLIASDSWDGKLRLWDARSGKEIVNIPAYSEGIGFAPDGRHIAVNGYSQSALQLFEIALNDITADAPAPPGGAQMPNYDTLVFGGRDRWLATCADQTVTLWRASDMKPLACVSNFSSSCAEWLPARGSIFTFNTNGLYCIPIRQTDDSWKAGPPEPFQPVIPPALETQCPPHFFNSFTEDIHPERSSASTNGQTAAITYRDRAYIFDMNRGALQAVTGEQTWMKFIGLSPDGRRLATGGWNNPNVKIWNAVTGAFERELATGYSPNAAFSPNGKWLVTSTSVDFSFWRISDWTLDHKIMRPPWGLPGPLCFSDDGKVLAVAYTRGVVRLISPDTGQTIAQLEPAPDNEVVALALTADLSELAATRFGEPPQVWRLDKIRQDLAAMKLDWTEQ